MTFWELLSAALASAGVFASVLGAFLTYAARKNGEATRALIRDMQAQTAEWLERADQRAAELRREVGEVFARMDQRAERMDQRADERHREVAEILDRIDQRGNDRHREVIEAISALKAT